MHEEFLRGDLGGVGGSSEHWDSRGVPPHWNHTRQSIRILQFLDIFKLKYSTKNFFEHTKCVVKFLRSALKCFIFNNVHTIECCHDRGQGTSTSLGIHQLRLLHFKSTNT